MENRDSLVAQAALYELLSKAFLYPDHTVADALVSGEYAQAAEEILTANRCPNTILPRKPLSFSPCTKAGMQLRCSMSSDVSTPGLNTTTPRGMHCTS